MIINFRFCTLRVRVYNGYFIESIPFPNQHAAFLPSKRVPRRGFRLKFSERQGTKLLQVLAQFRHPQCGQGYKKWLWDALGFSFRPSMGIIAGNFLGVSSLFACSGEAGVRQQDEHRQKRNQEGLKIPSGRLTVYHGKIHQCSWQDSLFRLGNFHSHVKLPEGK